MKGRHTSYQRFSSVLGTGGSVVSKYLRSLSEKRDSELVGKTAIDKSDEKGIYNKTLTAEDLIYDLKKEDLGEEVYGCIANILDTSTIEFDVDAAIQQRKDKRKISERKRSWFHDHGQSKGKEYEDWALIPQENIPLVVNSKFPLTNWSEEKQTVQEIPKGAGFTSGALVRPIAFSDKAEKKIENGIWFPSQEAFLYPHTLEGVPIKTAHAILNRCKEISLTGKIDWSIERKSKECSGVQSSAYEWTSSTVTGCPPGNCVDTGGKITLSCLSTQQTSKLITKGAIDLTARRHKQVVDFFGGGDPKFLDISGNWFYAGPSDEAAYLKTSHVFCDPVSDSLFVELPIPTIEQLAVAEKQEKLSSGCLTYPATSDAMVRATQESALKKEDLTIENCIEAYKSYALSPDVGHHDSYFLHGAGLFKGPAGAYLPGGVRRQDNNDYIRPEIISGPSLAAMFNHYGWDFGGVGKAGPENLYERECNTDEITHWYKYKGVTKSTGITLTHEGECPLFPETSRFDRGYPVPGCGCDDPCSKCKPSYGETRLNCECGEMCTPNPDDNKPCGSGAPSKCDCVYFATLRVGKYVGIKTPDPGGLPPFYDAIASVPLGAKMEAGATEDLTIWWNASFGHPQLPDGSTASALYALLRNHEIMVFLNEESANSAKDFLQYISAGNYETRSVGSMAIKCEDWSVSVPLFALLTIQEETTCAGLESGSNYYTTSKDAGNVYCQGCEDDADKECCAVGTGGCNGNSGESDGCCDEEFCDISDPCGYAVKAVDSRKCKQESCDAPCEDQEDPCGCCNCGATEEGCNPCPDYTNCPPFKVISNFEPMGCYGDAHEEDKHEASINLELEFKLFKEME